MTALAAARYNIPVKFSDIDLPGKAEQVFRGGIACWDTSTGLVAKAFVSINLHPIGFFDPVRPGTDGSVTTPSGGTVHVKLFREVAAYWFANASGGDACVAADLGGLAYFVDDQTVADNDATDTRSVAGRIWALDSIKGVLVEPIQTAIPHINGLDGDAATT